MNPIRLTPAVKGLLIACFAAFVIQQTGDRFFHTHFFRYFALTPQLAIGHGYIWQIFTYQFLHVDVIQLFFNLLMLAFIGSELEMVWGRARFLRFYFFCSTVAALTYLFLQLFVNEIGFPMAGASGAIFGLLMAYGLLFGEQVLLFMMLFPMKAKHFIWVLAAVEFMSSIFASQNPWGSIADLGGMAAAFGLLWGRAAWRVYRRRREEDADLRRRQKRRKSSNHLKLVINNRKGPSPDDLDQDSDDSPKTWH